MLIEITFQYCLNLYLLYVLNCFFYFSSANSYNLKPVGETLSQLLLQALQYHPTNVAWLKVIGDLNYGMYLNSQNQCITSKIGME